MRRSAPLLALALLATGCAEPDAPTVVTDDTVVVADGDAPADVTTDVADAPADGGADAPSGASPAGTGGAVTPMSAADAGEDAGPVEVRRAGDGRAATVTREVSVEGMTETTTLTLAAFPDFPAAFSTYVPESITVEQPGSGDAISFEWGAANVLVNVARGETAAAALARIREQAPPVSKNDLDAGWAEGAFAMTLATQADVTAVEVYVGEHDGTTYVIEASYPVEMGDGFAPVLQTMFDEWQWADGTALR